MSSTRSPNQLYQLELQSVATSLVVGFVATCAAFDVRVRRIPNLLTGGGMIAGLAVHLFSLGPFGVIYSLAGIAVIIAVLLAPFALGGIGGGDVKMMAAIGAMLGPRLAVASLAAGMILGGIVVVVHLIRLGRLREKLTRLRSMLMGAVLTRSAEPLRISAAEPGAVALPYSIPLGLGTLAVLAVTLRW